LKFKILDLTHCHPPPGASGGGAISGTGSSGAQSSASASNVGLSGNNTSGSHGMTGVTTIGAGGSASSMGELVQDLLLDRPPSPARLAYTSEKHPRSTFSELNLIRKHHELCDVVILVGNRKIFSHKVILAACSPYFRAMFTGELAESRQTEVTIRDVDETAMDILVDFCYTSYIVVEELPKNKENLKKNWGPDWIRENFHRNSLANGYKNFSDNDLIMISDLDEIPDPKKISEFRDDEKYACFIQKNFQQKINLLNTSQKYWAGTKICKKKYLKSPQWLRNIKTKKRPFWKFYKPK